MTASSERRFDPFWYEVCLFIMANWLYSAAGKVNLPDPDFWIGKQEVLWDTIKAFIANAKRVQEFWRLAPHLMELSAANVSHLMRSIHAVTGKPFLTDEEAKDKALFAKIQSDIQKRIAERFKQTGSTDYAVGYDFNRGLAQFDELIRTLPENDEAIRTILSSQLVLAWTAFETLVTDLWEVALNVHPNTLFNLSGTRRRIAKKAGRKPDEIEQASEAGKRDSAQIAIVALYKATSGTFNAAKKMGTILKSKFSFQRLSGIREAYSAAFPDDAKSNKVDTALADTAIDKLNLVRNVILHTAGIVDQELLDGAASINWVVSDQIGQPITLTGDRVSELINPVIQRGIDLISAIDEWIAPAP